MDARWRGFAGAREAAEFELRKEDGFQREVTLPTIYDRLAVRLGVDAALARDALARERARELRDVSVVPEIAAFVRELRERGLRVLYVSDMYLDEELIREMLAARGLLLPGDGLYVSSAHGVLKATGELFSLVLEREGLAPRELVHVGDNFESDLAAPRRLGITALEFSGAAPTPREAEFGAACAGQGLDCRIAGATRLARLEQAGTDPHETAVRAMAANVAGPLLTAFAAWILCTARDWNMERVYFLSRDGQILLRIARILEQSMRTGTDLRYLHVSRQALLLPGCTEFSRRDVDWLAARTWRLTPAMALARAGIGVREAAGVLERHGFSVSRAHAPLSDKAILKLRALFHDPETRDLVLAKAAEARKPALAYLEAQGLADGARFCVADLGWNGTLQRALDNILLSGGHAPCPGGLYLGLKRPASGTRSFLPGDDPRLSPQYPAPFIPILEAFAAADHGLVTGYRFQDGRPEPVLASPDNERGLAWGVREQQEAVLALARILAKNMGPAAASLPESRDAALAVLDNFLGAPFHSEAQALGSYMDAEEQNEAYHLPLGRPYSLADLARLRLTGRGRHHNEWTAGALALAAPWKKRLLGLGSRPPGGAGP